MKATYAVLSVLAMTVAGSALAGGGAYPEPYLWQGESTKSRAEVVAELEEAQRLGLLTYGEDGVKFSTPAQEQQIADAGRSAAEQGRVANGGH
jgi:hypothetical protein